MMLDTAAVTAMPTVWAAYLSKSRSRIVTKTPEFSDRAAMEHDVETLHDSFELLWRIWGDNPSAGCCFTMERIRASRQRASLGCASGKEVGRRESRRHRCIRRKICKRSSKWLSRISYLPFSIADQRSSERTSGST